LGRLAFWVVAPERKKALEHLGLALGGEKAEAELRQIAEKCFAHLGRSFFELARICYVEPERLLDCIQVEGLEHLTSALAEGRGVICPSAHLGNWELMAFCVARLGFPISVVAREINNAGINRLMICLRERMGVKTIVRSSRGRVQKSIIQTLKRNHILGMLIDQDARVEGVFVDFFGQPAYTPIGAVALSMATGAAIIPGFISRQADGGHKLVVLPRFELELCGDRQRDIQHNTAKLTKIIEQQIRKYPEQWVWMHRRWRRKPN